MSVLGKGERNHPKEGNALLETRGLDGKADHTFLWLAAFATDLNLELDAAQLRTRLSYRPIRIAERSLVFTCLWNVRDRPKYAALVKKIKGHWAYNLNQKRPDPMKLTYYGANKVWLGYIQNASFAFAVTDVVLSYQFQMRLINSATETVSRAQGVSPFMPSSFDAATFGPEWYKVGTLNRLARKSRDAAPANPGGPGSPQQR